MKTDETEPATGGADFRNGTPISGAKTLNKRVLIILHQENSTPARVGNQLTAKNLKSLYYVALIKH